MRMRYGRPVVVGVNGTPESEVALRWAVDEARLKHRSLHVVATYRWSEPTVASGHLATAAPPRPPQEFRDAYERALEYARDRLDPDRVSGELSVGVPTPALRHAAQSADRLVVGTRGRGLRHSVSRALAAQAACPVIVVRSAPAPATDRIVVGLDGSRESDHALAFAFEEAEQRRATVETVHCWRPYGSDAGYRGWIENTVKNLRRQVGDSVAPYREKYPDVDVVEQIVQGTPADELARRSASADLVVVGSRGRGRVVGSLLGSVSQSLLARAECPVAVVKSR